MRQSDADFLLAALQAEPGEWVAQHTIHNRSITERGCGLTVHSRASDLRARGFLIECQVRLVKNGRRASFYRLLTQPDDAVATSSGYVSGAVATRLGDAAQTSPLTGGDTARAPLFSERTRPAWA